MSDSSTNTIDPKDARMWARAGDAFFPCEKVEQKLPPGQYTIEFSQQRGLFFNKTKVTLDGLIDLPDAESDKVIKHIEHFWNSPEKFKEMGVLHKRGFLLWGPPGSGKTTTIQQVSKMIIDRKGLSVYVKDPELAAKGLEILRRIEPDRPIVVMMEDLDAMTGGRHDSESHILALLDGELQIENVVYVATTNYPERLDKRLVNRPSRFDVVQKIDMPNAEGRRTYLKYKHPVLETMPYPAAENNADREKANKEIDLISRKIADQEKVVFEIQESMSSDDINEVETSRLNGKLDKANKTLEGLKKQATEIEETLSTMTEDRKLLDYWVEHTEGFSIAHLKELVISVFCFDTSFKKAHSRLSKMNSSSITSNSGAITNI